MVELIDFWSSLQAQVFMRKINKVRLMRIDMKVIR